MTALTRDAILAARDEIIKAVEVPEWGGTVYVRSMSIVDKEAYMAEVMGRTDKNFRGLQVLLARLTLCDAQGALLFGAEDVELLGQKSPAALDRILGVAMQVNGLSDEALETRKGE